MLNIEYKAFTHNNLSIVEPPSWIEYIWEFAFAWNNLTMITIPENIKIIFSNSFSKNWPKKNSFWIDVIERWETYVILWNSNEWIHWNIINKIKYYLKLFLILFTMFFVLYYLIFNIWLSNYIKNQTRR